MQIATVDLSPVTTGMSDTATAMVGAFAVVFVSAIAVAGLFAAATMLWRFFKPIAKPSDPGEN